MAKLFCDNTTFFFFSKLDFCPLHLIFLNFFLFLFLTIYHLLLLLSYFTIIFIICLFFILKQKVKENLLKTKQTNKKTPFKQRPGSKEFTLKISNIQRTDTYPSQTLPNHWRAWVTPKVIPWIYYHSDIKTKDTTRKKKKLEANIFDEYRWKNSYQNLAN